MSGSEAEFGERACNAGASLPQSTCATAFPAVEHEGLLWLRPTPLHPGRPFDRRTFNPAKELQGARRSWVAPRGPGTQAQPHCSSLQVS